MPNAIGVDLGRHRSFCSLRTDDHRGLIPVTADGDTGLWLRWSGSGRSERITDRILRLAGTEQLAATETVQRVVEALFPELDSGRPLAGTPLVVVPPSFGPACRDAVRAGFAAVGLDVEGHHLVDRPLAALAGWLADAADHPPTGVVGLIDNDHGQLSFCAADLDTSRLLVSVPLSRDAFDDPGDVGGRLNDALDRVARLVAFEADEPRVLTGGAWPGVERVVLSGTRTDDARLQALASMVLRRPTGSGNTGSENTEVGNTTVLGDETAPVLGLLHLDVFTRWTACWPTLSITLDDVTFSDGYASLRAGAAHHAPDRALVANPGAGLGLARAGDAVALVAGSVRGTTVELPPDLGPSPRLRVFDDGRVLVLGSHSARPMSLRVLWPAPTNPVSAVPIEAIGRRPVVLRGIAADSEGFRDQVRPTADRPHRAKVS